MKKTLLLLLAVLMCGIVSTRAEEVVWGYNTSTNAFDGIGTKQTGTFGAGLFKTGGLYSKAKLVAVRIPVMTANMKDIRICIGKTMGGTDIFSQVAPDVKLVEGQYCRVDLIEPVTIPMEGAVVSYTFKIESLQSDRDNYPIAVCNDNSGYLTLCVNNQWEDMSHGQYGSCALQLVFDDMPDVQNFLTFNESCVLENTLAGSTGNATLNFLSDGKQPVSTIGYEIECGGEVTSSTYTFDTPQKSEGSQLTIPATFKAPATAGRYDAKVKITSVNGMPNEAGEVVFSCSAPILSRAEKRYTLVEEFTGTGCQYCPMGWVGMKKIKEEASDIAGVIALHLYNSSDPMYNAAYPVPPFNSAPQCCIDRRAFAHAYYGFGDEGILNSVRALQASELPSVVPTLSAKFDNDFTKVEVSSDVEFLTDCPDYTVTIALTGDGLTGTASSWKQTNGLYSASQTRYPEDLRPFCTGGEYGKAYVPLVYDDVFLSSTWINDLGGLRNTIGFTTDCKLGSTEHIDAAVKLPTKTIIKNALKLDKIYATIIVFNNYGGVANAARCHVAEPEGIHTVLAPVDAEGMTYDLSGRQAAARQSGINIVNGKKYISK